MTDPAFPDPTRPRDAHPEVDDGTDGAPGRPDSDVDDVDDEVVRRDDEQLDDQHDEQDDEQDDEDVEPLRPAAVVAAVALLAGAALSIFAPFRTFFVTTFDLPARNGNQAGSYQLAVDGWGRYNTAASSSTHGVRFGVVLVACAALFLVLAAMVAASTVDAERWRPRLGVVAAAAVGVTGAVAGVLATSLLSLDSAANQLQIGYRQIARETSTSPGWFIWTMVAVVVLGVVAVTAVHRMRTDLPVPPRDVHRRPVDDEPRDDAPADVLR